MIKITVIGDTKTDYPNLKRLDGIDCQEEFTGYFSEKYGDKLNQQSLIDKGVFSGYMSFKYDKENDKLITINEYKSPEKLTDEELEILKKYTQGQWSDGIGEGFEQFPALYDETFGDDGEIFISPWHSDQVITITQEEI